MKHTKIFFALLAVTAAVLAFGCKKATDSAGFIMNTQQKVLYEGFITGIENSATSMDYPASSVKQALDTIQVSFQAAGFKVEDKTPNQDVKKGTKADALKKRFVPSAK